MNLLEKFVVNNVMAADIPKIIPKDQGNVSAQVLAEKIIDVLLWIAGIIAFIYIVYSGILYLTAAGNEDNAKKGQKGILYGVIGIVVIVAAWVIIGAAVDLGKKIG